MSGRGLLQTSAVAKFTKERIVESRAGGNVNVKVERDSADTRSRRDFLSRFQEAGTKDPAFMDEGRVLSLTTSNVVAGSDTTAISLRAIFYNLIRHPDKMAKLRAEFDDAESKGIFVHGDPLVKWNDVRELPYLSAVISESLRIHPAVGLPLERITPAGGIQICDTFIPPGTIIGCSAWLLHRDKALWGEDADSWRPERWIEASDTKKAEMKNSMFAFGAGARTCIGKNISYLEMYKLVPAVLRSYDVCFCIPK